MPTPVICLSKHTFRLGRPNTFRIYGENLNDLAVPLKVELLSTAFDWNPATIPAVANADRKPHFVVITSTPSPKAVAPAPAPLAAAAPAPVADTYDDLTITLTFNEGAPDEQIIEEDHVDVTYEDPGPGP